MIKIQRGGFMKKIVLAFLFFALINILSGCSPFVEIKKESDFTIEQREKLSVIKVYDRNELPAGSYRIIEQSIWGVSCKNLLWDPAANRYDALKQLKMKAVELNGDGLINVQCREVNNDLSANCWHSFTCYGDVIQLKLPKEKEPGKTQQPVQLL